MITKKQKPNTPEELNNILNPLVKQWFYSRFKEFSLPQLYGVMEIHSRKNVLISAPTGATKTLTAFLSILNELVTLSKDNALEDKVYCIYISPLKALNQDIQVNLLEPLSEIEAIAGRKLNIRVSVRTGDTTPSEKTSMLKHPPHILITTPESLGIILSSMKFINLIKKIDWVVVDEIHALAENKRGVHLSLSLERLASICYFCRIGLSATISPIEEVAKFLVGKENDYFRPCTIVDVQFIKKMDLKVLCPSPNLIDSTYEDMQNSMYELMDSLIQSHKTTLIFTNTRAMTERVVFHLKERYPRHYSAIDDKDIENDEIPKIGAHHGSLSKSHRFEIEKRLREGKLKVVACSTSLELGIDIGYIDLVILLGSPKTVARALQRIGRSGHRLNETTKGRIIVLDRDDLVECSLILKMAIEQKIDKIHIPRNCLDVLAQQIFGIAIAERINIKDLYSLIKKSYSYIELSYEDFMQVIGYLAGTYASLEDRNIYAKIWYDEETGMIGKRGRMARVIYMTNIGTIPEETAITVKIGNQMIGKIDESFAEKLRAGDIFVLGGDVYRFKFSSGMVAQVTSAENRKPTIPAWFSEILPLSFDLALEIGRFRRIMEEKFLHNYAKEDIISFLNIYLYIDNNSALSIYDYFREQFLFAQIPSDRKIIVEHYNDSGRKYAIFHTLYGRRVNDCLSRAVAMVISRIQHKDAEIGINDNGFYVASKHSIQALNAFKILNSAKLSQVMDAAIDKTEVMKRRFRHCAARSLMILRNYKGKSKHVGRQQVSSMILMNAIKRISVNFCILKEARREVLEDLMDIENATLVLKQIEEGKIKVNEISTTIPSPFAFTLISQGYTDIIRVEDRMAFLHRMHKMVLAQIGKNSSDDIVTKAYEEIGKEEKKEEFDYVKLWKKEDNEAVSQKNEIEERLRIKILSLEGISIKTKSEIIDLIDDKTPLSQESIKEIDSYKEKISGKDSQDMAKIKDIQEILKKLMPK